MASMWSMFSQIEPSRPPAPPLHSAIGSSVSAEAHGVETYLNSGWSDAYRVEV